MRDINLYDATNKTYFDSQKMLFVLQSKTKRGEHIEEGCEARVQLAVAGRQKRSWQWAGKLAA